MACNAAGCSLAACHCVNPWYETPNIPTLMQADVHGNLWAVFNQANMQGLWQWAIGAPARWGTMKRVASWQKDG